MINREDNIRLEGKLVQSIKLEGLVELTQDYIELGLDSVLKEGLAKDIPIIGTIVNLAKIAGGVRDRLYIAKLVRFLNEVGNTTQKDRERFIEENCKDTRFEHAVLLILEQADNMEKATLIGKVFKACILAKITYEDAVALSSMINKTVWQDVVELLRDKCTYESEMRLCNCGLLTLHWMKRVHEDLTKGIVQQVAFDGFSARENKCTKMLKVAAKL
jgi:hypothetical protein